LSDLDCRHGRCERGLCHCALLYAGEGCEKMVGRPPSPSLKHIHFFRGAHVLSKENVGEGTEHERVLQLRMPGQKMPQTLGMVDAALLRALPPQDLFGGDARPYATCAVVGSSGSLLSAERGAEIDAHSMVMRFNDAPTKGFSIYVGSKTTYRLCTAPSASKPCYRETAAERVLQNVTSKEALRVFLHEHRMHRKQEELGEVAGLRPLNLFALHPELIVAAASSFSFSPSIGLVGVLIALHNCLSVDVYGMKLSTHHGFAHLYYARGRPPADADVEEQEYVALAAMRRLGLLSFADKCLLACHSSAIECLDCFGFEERR